jgi:hypothetical protein
MNSLEPKESPEPQKKPLKKKTLIATSCVMIVLVLASSGMWIWHSQPSFCGTVCHTPMAPYVASLSDGKSLASTHGEQNFACLDCHESNLGQQITEVGKFITGDYTVPLPSKDLATKDFCMRSGCHDSYEQLAEKTDDYDLVFNPHESHYGELDCYQCHSVHKESEFYCTSCHQGLKLPEGWKAAPMS